MRGLDLTGVAPDEIYAGQPALLGATIANRKRWFTSYSVTVELLAPEARALESASASSTSGGSRRGASVSLTWEETLPQRGRHRLTGVRITTRFPFGLFVKAARPDARPTTWSCSRRCARSPPRRSASSATSGDASARRRGRGNDLYNLRGYRAGRRPAPHPLAQQRQGGRR